MKAFRKSLASTDRHRRPDVGSGLADPGARDQLDLLVWIDPGLRAEVNVDASGASGPCPPPGDGGLGRTRRLAFTVDLRRG
jgi:hypothetical protein